MSNSTDEKKVLKESSLARLLEIPKEVFKRGPVVPAMVLVSWIAIAGFILYFTKDHVVALLIVSAVLLFLIFTLSEIVKVSQLRKEVRLYKDKIDKMKEVHQKEMLEIMEENEAQKEIIRSLIEALPKTTIAPIMDRLFGRDGTISKLRNLFSGTDSIGGQSRLIAGTEQNTNDNSTKQK